MRYLLTSLLLAVVVLSSGCDSDGYSCNSEGCYAENNAQYLTLEDCLSICDEQIPGGCGSPVLHEGYHYSTVQIGEQCWFSENCRYLPTVSFSLLQSETDPYYFVYDYYGTDVEAAKSTENYETYGVLYNWPAVMTEGICPSGWHIPSDGEFTELTDFLGGESVAGFAMKSTSGWNVAGSGESGDGSNSSGFNGLPGGVGGEFVYNGGAGWWWSSSESDYNSWTRSLWSGDDAVIARSDYSRSNGFSARCVQD